jgi:hypothetical protein
MAVLGKEAGGIIRSPVLERSPSAKPIGCIQMQVSPKGAERLTLLEEQVRHFQPSHETSVAAPIPRRAEVNW